MGLEGLLDAPGGGAPMRFPVWAIVAMVAATVVLSVATTLITLAVEHLRQSRHAPAAEAEPEPGQAEIHDPAGEHEQGLA